MKEKGRGSKKYKEWRLLILERDNYKCVICQSEKYLHCDHIIPWNENPDLRFDVSNGQTLCAACHLKKGIKNKEIDGSANQFKKGECLYKEKMKGRIPWNKGIKTQIPAWNKGKKWDEETRKKMSISGKGKRLGNTNGFKKGQVSLMKGKHHTEESKEKNRKAHLGKRASPATEFKKGMIPWNKGLKSK